MIVKREKQSRNSSSLKVGAWSQLLHVFSLIAKLLFTFLLVVTSANGSRRDSSHVASSSMIFCVTVSLRDN